MNSRLAPKITELFDILEKSLEIGDWEHADVTVARLSKYFHLFDDEHSDYYQYAQDVVDEMLNGDIEAILIFLRNTSFGPEYTINLMDPATGKMFQHTFIIDEINFKTLAYS